MSQTHSVLLVEDDQADAYITQKVFCDIAEDITLSHSETGESALEWLATRQAQGTLPGLILLDLNMPGMDGFAFLEQTKGHETLRSIPVVVLTTSASQGDVDRAYALGAAGYVVKPNSIDDFTHYMQRLVGYWFSLVKRPD
ncbi:response regulator [Halomonas llamarensis]|uniref:Response regulator n=1 Tax=Halomonas llamarensis TaxID=2945104 RepID=A0ABT0SU03_9GAMM|nr:response regulator [Halomonas llamarensis]MCL7931196.1 response regulator [Halomonas llamarensis]